MSYLSSEPPTFSDTTFNLPTVLTTLISVGLHGLLWVVTPTFNSASKAASNGGRTVGIVQLTPDEMKRLPEYSLPLPNLPNIPASPSGVLPPLPPMQSYNILPSLPNPNGYIPPLAENSQVPGNVSGSSSQKRSPSPRQDRKLNQNGLTSSQPEIKIESRLTPQTPLTEEIPTRPQRSRINEGSSVQPRSTTVKPSTTPQQPNIATGIDRGITSNETLPTFPPGTVSPPITQSNPAVVPKENTQPITPSNLEAHLPSFYGKPSAPPSGQQPSQEFTDSLIKYRNNYDPAGTTNEYAAGKLSAWLEEKNKQLSVNLKIKSMPETILLKSPVNEKLPDLSQANVAILVSPKGKGQGKPELIRSTGYPALDRAALENIQQRRTFPPTGKYEIYLYRLEFDQTSLNSNPGSSANG